jgi:polyphosphate kinase 2 (PPK2 family)
MKRARYEKELHKLQVKLCHLQRWVKEKGLRVVDRLRRARRRGKGGTIKAITERVSPRVFRVVALPAPSDREKAQMYMQRYVAALPAPARVVIFDRSWYNRAGVEYVMGFCTESSTSASWSLSRDRDVPRRAGHHLIKLWLEVSNDEQKRRFEARIEDPDAAVEAEPDGPAVAQAWYDYSRARDVMLKKPTRGSRRGTSCGPTTSASARAEHHRARARRDPLQETSNGGRSSCRRVRIAAPTTIRSRIAGRRSSNSLQLRRRAIEAADPRRCRRCGDRRPIGRPWARVAGDASGARQLLAPVALYPDQLLAQMLLCSANPARMRALNEWLRSHETLKGTELQDRRGLVRFRDSYVALVLFPTSIEYMAVQADWTAHSAGVSPPTSRRSSPASTAARQGEGARER